LIFSLGEMGMYDAGKLVNNADFEIPIYKKVFWVPYNVLGKTQYTNDEIFKLSMQTNNLKGKLTNPYEVIQYIKKLDFKSADDVEVVNNLYCHTSGISTINTKKGSCASYSGLLYHLLNNLYDIYNFCILNNHGTGHAINFIKYKNAIYFCDLYSQLNEFYPMAVVENGHKIEFARASNMFSFCLKTTDVEEYIKLIEKRNLFKNREWFYFVAKSSVIPSVYIEHDSSDKIYVKVDRRSIVEWYLKPSIKKIKLEIV